MPKRRSKNLNTPISEETNLLELMGVPLRATKEAVSGDELEWFPPGGMNPHAYAAGNTALDLVGDPLNYVGGGMMKLGAAGKKLPGSIASMSNYITDWYSPDAVKKAGGFARWGMDSAASMVEHALSPTSRANFAENAVTSPAQRRIKNLDPTDTRATEKGVSQVQYTSGHIPEQTGGAASTNPAAKEILDRSFVEGYGSTKGESISNALQRHGTKENTSGTKYKSGDKRWKDAPTVNTSKADADFVQSYAKRTQDNPDKFVLKSPVAKETGGHHNDVVYKNPAKAALKDAYAKLMDADGNVSPEALANHLRVNRSKANAKLPHKSTWNIEKVDDDGVWLRGGKVGSAITEGGVSWLMKVSPDGTLQGYMLDSHDFAEKLVPGAIQESLLAITPTMRNNIKNIAGPKGGIEAVVKDAAGNAVKVGRKTQKKLHTPAATYQQTPPRTSGEPYKGLLEDYVNIKPSQMGVAREQGALVGEGLLTQRYIDNSQDE